MGRKIAAGSGETCPPRSSLHISVGRKEAWYLKHSLQKQIVQEMAVSAFVLPLKSFAGAMVCSQLGHYTQVLFCPA